MEQVQVFDNEIFGSVRGMLINGNPWFIANDVAKALGYRDTYNLTRRLKEKQKGTHKVSTLGGVQNLSVINEAGMYKAIMRSNLPKAEEFTDWVAEEVLPSIRKTGSYIKSDENEYLRKDWMIDTLVDFRERCFIPLKNKAKLVDLLEVTDDCILIGDFAKLMCQNGIDTSRPKAFAELREHGWLMKKGKENLPTQKAINAGYLKIKETISDSGVVFRTPVITGKGQVHFMKQAIKILERRKAVSG